MKQWSASKLQGSAFVHQNKVCGSSSTGRASVNEAIHIAENEPEQRPLSGLSNNSNSISTCGFVINNEIDNLNRSRQVIGRKCLTQEALICHELGFAESDEDQTNQKKDMIVRWLNSEALNSCPRPFPQL